MTAPPGELKRPAGVGGGEPFVRLAVLPRGDGTAAAPPSYEERAGGLVRRAATPEGLATGELDRVWERLTRGRPSPAPRGRASWTWTRWTLAAVVLGASGAAVAAVTGAWTWPRVAWHQVQGSSSPPRSPSPASRAPRARSLATTGRGLAPRPSEATSPPPPAPPVPALASPAPPEAAVTAPSAPPASPRRTTATRVPGPLGVPSSSSAAGHPLPPAPLAPPGPAFSLPVPVTPAPFAAPPPSARPAPRPGDLALAEEGELLGRAVARLRQAHDPTGAIADLDRYAARFPSGVLHREAQTARVDALLMAGRSAEARRALSQLTLGGDARDRELRLIRAELAAESAPASALQDFQAVWAAHPTGATGERSLWGMAGCHARLGDESGTRAALNLYLARFPDGPHAAAAAARTARRE